MIYVIISPVYVKKGDYTKYDSALKIGYSSDKKKTYKGRFSAYNTENPTNEVLFKVMGGTKRDEKNLHKYFSKYQKKFEDNDTREWFEYCQEILDFFKTNTTIESIREAIKTYFGKRKKIYKEKISKSLPIVWPYIISIKEIIGKLNYSILEDYTLDCPDNFCEEWIKTYYPKEFDKILDYYRFVQSKITLEMAEFIDKLRKTDKGYFNSRLKELCESKFTEEEKSIIAQQVSEKFDRYYNILGPDRCRACGYRSTDLEREIRALNSKDNIMKEFYSRFEIGKRYTNAEAKSIVGKIYIDLSLLYKIPKATDIFEYFEVKRVSIFLPDKKKVNGLELLNIKRE